MTANTQNINAKSVAKYLLLPGIIPRAKEFAGSGFGYLAFLFARVYGAVRILPPSHPFLDPANIGKFTILQAMAAAANNLTFSRRNIDQLVVFIALLAGLILMVLQFVLLILTFISGDAFANPTGGVNFLSMFVTQFPETDVAFLMLDYVFGIPGAAGGTTAFFGSNALIPNGPTPFHVGMQALFQFYNLAILLVGVIIFAYYVFVVVIETAQTGVPFGRRFSKLYAPLRLVIAIGLLIPLNYGFNGAQYITLTVAKMGSSFATNGWLLYNSINTINPLGIANTALVARPRQPYLDDLLQFSSVYHTCREMYRVSVPRNEGSADRTCIGAYVVVNGQTYRFAGMMGAGCETGLIGAVLGNGTGANYDYEQAKRDLAAPPANGAPANNNAWGTGDLEVILGEYDPLKHSDKNGSVAPYCGKMTISLNHNNPRYYTGPADRGTVGVEKAYYNLVRMMLNPSEQLSLFGPFSITGFGADDFSLYRMLGERSAHMFLDDAEYQPCIHSSPAQGVPTLGNIWGNILGGIGNAVGGFFGMNGGLGDAATCGGDDWAPPSSVFQGTLDNYKLALNEVIRESYTAFVNNINLALTDDQRRRGWGGAGIWYNQIADLNGGFTGAIYSTPSVREFPEVMANVKDAKAKKDKTSDYCNTFDPNLSDGKSVELKNYEYAIAKAGNQTFRYFCDRQNQETGNAPAAGAAPAATNSNSCSLSPLQHGAGAKGATSNVFMDVVSLVFGLNGLFDLRACSQANPTTGHPLVHPLAQLSAIGKSLVENAIRSMGMALGASFGGGILGVLSPALGGSLQALSGMFVTIATIGLSVGFILYYILPFLPFIYFFFAVGAWVKSIFEAMVGVPLWALAHIHIDGEGLPGKAAMPGYWLLFEIFLRPIVTVFGLIGGMACFGALTIALNNLFDLVVINSTGAAPGDGTTDLTPNELTMLRSGTVDHFFFTVMYAILVYLMATASFKMIDTIPKAFMRWMNTGVSTFNDNKGDPTSELTSYAAMGGARVTGQLFQGLNTGVGGAGRLAGEIAAAAGGGKKE